MCLSNFLPCAKAISVLLYPFAEVILHDLTSGKIAAIYNNFSKRKVGEDSLIQDLDKAAKLPDVFPLYPKTNWDGKNIKSVTATLRNDAGDPIGLMCINLEISKWEEMYQFLGQWIGKIDLQHQQKALFKNDWKEKINYYVSQYLKTHGFTLRSLNKEKKQALILALQHEGAFKAKNAATYIGEVLDLSRATIYNYLKNNAGH